MNEALEEVTSADIPTLQKNIPIGKIIELRNKKLSTVEIGKLLGCSHANISQRLRGYKESIEHLEAIKENRADTYAVIGDVMLNSITHEDILKSSAYQKVGMAGYLHNMERLERDKSTSNVAYADVTRPLPALIAEAEGLKAELGLGQDADSDDNEDAPWTVDTDDSKANTD